MENDDGTETTFHLKSEILDPEEKFVKKQKIKMLHELVKKLIRDHRNDVIEELKDELFQEP